MEANLTHKTIVIGYVVTVAFSTKHKGHSKRVMQALVAGTGAPIGSRQPSGAAKFAM